MSAGIVAISDWRNVQEHARKVRFNPGEYLCSEGATDQSVYVLISGTVRIVVASRSGSQVVLGERGPGELVGEMAFLDDGPRSAGVVAKVSVEAYLMTASGFAQVLGAQPQLALDLLSALAVRLREITARVASRSSDIESRLAERLLLLADTEGADKLGVTQQELAEWVDATREAVARALANFRSEGLVSTGRGTLTITDRPGLAGHL